MSTEHRLSWITGSWKVFLGGMDTTANLPSKANKKRSVKERAWSSVEPIADKCIRYVLAITMVSAFLYASILATPSAVAQRVADNVPGSIHQAVDLGLVDPTTEINITVNLNPRDRAAFDKTVDALYDPSSPTFRKWLTNEDLKAYAPTTDQYNAVRKELEAYGLTILSTGENGFSIRAHGTVGNIESAFNTQIHEFQKGNQVFRANVVNAHLSGSAADYVSTVAGLESHNVHPLLTRAINQKTHEPPATVALTKVQSSGGLSSIITDQFLSAPTAYKFTTPGASLPVGLYYGNVYQANPNLVPDYTPAQLQSYYGLPAAYQQNLNGSGQTIVLLEAYGYPTIESDANAFFSLNGLPLLNSSNFSIVYPEGLPVSPEAGELTGWNIEIALDLQWSHVIAPGAKIIVVATAGQDNEDFLDAINYIVDHNLGNVVNDSWEVDLDLIAGPLEEEAFDNELKIAAAKGISFQFSSGDGGDDGLGTPVGAPGVPSNSPHATAVGGTSILNTINGTGFQTLGWGNTAALLDEGGVLDPPGAAFFVGGSGGGESVYFPKPAWQKALPGTGRQVPDVSALADPYTGVPIVVTENGVQGIEAGWGGTSLASPIFTAFWAIANQKAGHSLGQAAPTIARLAPGDLLDVLPLSSPTNTAGTIFDSSGSTNYSPSSLFSGELYSTTGFISAVWSLEGSYYDFGFGLDSSLAVTQGWDNVTGFGTPNGLPFLEAVSK